MDDLLEDYLTECSRIFDARGYPELERALPLIKENLSKGNGGGQIIDKYNKETVKYCEELIKKGVRIGLDNLDWGELRMRLTSIALQ